MLSASSAESLPAASEPSSERSFSSCALAGSSVSSVAPPTSAASGVAPSGEEGSATSNFSALDLRWLARGRSPARLMRSFDGVCPSGATGLG